MSPLPALRGHAGRAGRSAIAIAILGLLVIILCRASAVEDAFVSFRVIDNFVHGYGLCWNVGERVQAYTNPLWMLLHIPFYALWPNIFYITLALSVACTLGAIAFTLRTVSRPPLQTIALFLAPLAASRSFTEYSTSGLENPLTHLLFAAFGWALLIAGRERRWFWCVFIVSLSLVNRLDTILIYIPAMGYLLAREYRTINLRQCLLGALPIIAWEAFSLFYYGFLFPNTKYAKLGAGIPESAYLLQGLRYLYNLAVWDTAGALFLAGAVAAALFGGILRRKWLPEITPELQCLALGILCYSLYVIGVGGSFITGRFWSLSVFASAWLAYGVGGRISPQGCVIIITLLFCINLDHPSYHDIVKYFPQATKGISKGGLDTRLFRHFMHGQALPVADTAPPSSKTVLVTVIGKSCFQAGPLDYCVNDTAISDPLLARLPANNSHISRIGHLMRDVPAGYLDALKTGSLAGMDPALAQYYAKLRIITSGNLWSLDRISEILKFNLGYYDYLRDEYVQHHPPKEAEEE